MKRIAFGIAVVAVLTFASSAAASRLRMPDARSGAERAALDFQIRHHLDESNVARCRRRAPGRVDCAATVKGESATRTTVCKLRITVRAIAHGLYTTNRAAIGHHRCATTTKKVLAYSAAFNAIQAQANAFAGQPAAVTDMFRRDTLTYSARAVWERAALHPTEFEPTENCSVDLVATLAAAKITVVTEGFACY